MYFRLINQVWRPGFRSLNRIQKMGMKSSKNIKIVTSVTEEIENRYFKGEKLDKASKDEKRKKAITYLYYDPSLTDRIMIWKARFLAMGWMYVACGLLTYLAVKFANRLEKFVHRDRYAI